MCACASFCVNKQQVISREESKEHERAHQQQEEEKQQKQRQALSASFASISTTATTAQPEPAAPALAPSERQPLPPAATTDAAAAAAVAAGTDDDASATTAEGGRRASRRAAARKREQEETAAVAVASTGAGNGGGRKKESKAVIAPPPEPLRCFCRLPEHEGKMRTLVQCAGCEEWYHPHCVSLAVKEIRYLGGDYLCPVCRHHRGLSSELAAPPLAGRFGLVRASRPRLEALRALWGEARALTIAEFEAVPFLSFLLDAAEQWRGRTRNALLALLPALQEAAATEGAGGDDDGDGATQATLAALAAEAEAAEREKAERRAAEEAEVAAAAEKARAARERKSGPVPPPPPRRKLPSASESLWEAHEREELAAVVRALRETRAMGEGGESAPPTPTPLSARLAAEARALRFAARLMSEHRVLEITVSEQLVERLKALLWRLVAPLCLPPAAGLLAVAAAAEAADDAAKEAKARRAREALKALFDSAGALCEEGEGEKDEAAKAADARRKAAEKKALARARRLGRRIGLEPLCAVLEEGRRLGLTGAKAWRRLAEARDDALFWLRAASALPFPRLLPAVLAGRGCPGLCDAAAPALGAPPREAQIDYHGEWAYARARAAVVRSNRLHGHLPPVEGRAHLPRPQATGPKIVWEVDKGLAEAAAAAPGEQFCVCRGQESGEMVCCEGCGEWHHFDCVGYRPPAAAAGGGKKGGKTNKKKREEREDGEAAFVCIGCSEAAQRPYRYKWTTPLFKAYASLKLTPSAAVPTEAPAGVLAAHSQQQQLLPSSSMVTTNGHGGQQHHQHKGKDKGSSSSSSHGYSIPAPRAPPSVASAFAAFSQRAYTSTPEPPVPRPRPSPRWPRRRRQPSSSRSRCRRRRSSNNSPQRRRWRSR